MLLRIDLVKNDKNSLKMKDIIHVFVYIATHVPNTIFDVIICDPFTPKYEKSQQKTPY
jgi:hypothetical protein